MLEAGIQCNAQRRSPLDKVEDPIFLGKLEDAHGSMMLTRAVGSEVEA